jgi:hypothetical protein
MYGMYTSLNLIYHFIGVKCCRECYVLLGHHGTGGDANLVTWRGDHIASLHKGLGYSNDSSRYLYHISTFSSRNKLRWSEDISSTV